MMKIIKLLSVLYLTLGCKVSSSSSQRIVTFKTEDNLVSPLVQGSDVTMVCTASGYSGDVGQHIQIIKTIIPSDGSGPLHITMVTNMQINNEYSTMVDMDGNKRYSSDLEVLRITNSTKAILTFKLKAITGTDAGSYNCSVSYGNNEIVTSESLINLQIQGRLDTIHWLKRLPDGSTNDINGDILTVAPTANFSLVCSTTSTDTPAQPQFDVHFLENNRKVDIISWFTPDPPQDEINRIPGKAYTFNITSRRSLSYDLQNPTKRLDQKLLVCQATSPGLYETISLRALVTLRIEYAPTLSCAKMSQPFGIRCSAEGNPLPVVTMTTVTNTTISSEQLQVMKLMQWKQYSLEKKVTGQIVEFSVSANKTDFSFGPLVITATNVHGSSPSTKFQLPEDFGTSSANCFHKQTTLLLIFLAEMCRWENR